MKSVSRLKILGTVVLAVSLGGCGQQESSKDSNELIVTIGSASQLSGPQAHIGTDIRNGVQLAIEDANKSGVRIGGKSIKFILMAEDDEANPTKATIVAQKLVDSKVAAVVGHVNSNCSIPASKIYADAGIPQISPTSTNPDYTFKGYKTTFRVVAHDGLQGPALGKFSIEKLNAKYIAVIDDSTTYGQGLADNFEVAVKALGVQVVARERTTDKDTDFKAILTKIKHKKPDLIMFGGTDPQAAPMVRQMAELGIKAGFIGGDGIQTPNFIKLAGNDAEGVVASLNGLPKDLMPGGKAFLEKFRARFGVEVELYAPMAYDAVMVFIEAMKRAGSTEPAKYLTEVGKTNYQGVIGPIAFDERGDLKNSPITIYTVKSGKWEPQEIVSPTAAESETAQGNAKK